MVSRHFIQSTSSTASLEVWEQTTSLNGADVTEETNQLASVSNKLSSVGDSTDTLTGLFNIASNLRHSDSAFTETTISSVNLSGSLANLRDDNVMDETAINEEEWVHPDNYSIVIKIAFSAINMSFVVFCILALIALNRTKRTPPTARFLSSGLITFDLLAVTFFSIRRFLANHASNTIVQVIGISFCFNAFITIGLMSLERYVLFRAPNFYIRCITVDKVKVISYASWIITSLIYFFVRFGVCFAFIGGTTLHDVIGKCNMVSFMLYYATILIVIVMAYVCYWKIVRIIKTSNFTHKMNDYRSTSLVFIYIITITLTSLGYLVSMFLDKLDRSALLISSDSVNTFNNMADPCMYIFWYRECRMEMLKMIGCGTRALANKVETMRRDIFEVVTKMSTTDLSSSESRFKKQSPDRDRNILALHI